MDPSLSVPSAGEPAEHPPELADLTLGAAAELVESRTVSPEELVEAHLRWIEEIDPRISAHLSVCAERARESARRAGEEIAAGRRRGPLHGIPFGVKDTYLTAGVRTTAASRLFESCVPDSSATAVDRLEAAGAVLVGKHNTWELGTGTGEVAGDLAFGVARNPWDLSRYTGGSSTGTAAAVAAGMAMFGMASDTGASIRAPSAAHNLVGVKPTYGRMSRAGIIPNTSTFDAPGPIARTVRDAALVLEVVAGHDPADPTSAPRPVPRYTASLDRGVMGLAVGVVRGFGTAGSPALDEEVSAALDRAAEVLAGEGAAVVDCVIPHAMVDFRRIMRIVGGSESLAIHLDHVRRRHPEMGVALRDKFLAAAGITAVEFLTAQRLRRDLAAVTDATVSAFDAVLAPGPIRTVPRLDDPDGVVAYVMGATTVWCNVTGHPAVALPAGFDRSGMPIGVQVVGRHWDEETILAVAAAHEAATEWTSRRPTFAGTPVDPVPLPAPESSVVMPADEAREVAARLGIEELDPETLARLAALAGDTRAAAAELPGDLPWSLEPATTFSV